MRFGMTHMWMSMSVWLGLWPGVNVGMDMRVDVLRWMDGYRRFGELDTTLYINTRASRRRWKSCARLMCGDGFGGRHGYDGLYEGASSRVVWVQVRCG